MLSVLNFFTIGSSSLVLYPLEALPHPHPHPIPTLTPSSTPSYLCPYPMPILNPILIFLPILILIPIFTLILIPISIFIPISIPSHRLWELEQVSETSNSTHLWTRILPTTCAMDSYKGFTWNLVKGNPRFQGSQFQFGAAQSIKKFYLISSLNLLQYIDVPPIAPGSVLWDQTKV